MKAKEALIAWNVPDDESPGAIEVGLLIEPGRSVWTDKRRYVCTGGAAHHYRRKMKDLEQTIAVLTEFVSLVVVYKLDPRLVHGEFWKIDEYRAALLEFERQLLLFGGSRGQSRTSRESSTRSSG
jgi:hypothetical protein